MQIASPTNIVFQAGSGYPEVARFTSLGRLGIGQNNPQFLIDVAQSPNDATIRVTSANAGAWFTANSNSAYGGCVSQIGGVDKWVAGMNGADTYVIQRGRSGSVFTTIDPTGNMGLGVTPSSWNVYRALQVGPYGVLFTDTGGTEVNFGSNVYYNTGYKYIGAAAASFYRQLGGAHTWYNAPSGAANDAITFTQQMTLDANGNLGVGMVPGGGYKLEVNGAINVVPGNTTGTQVGMRFYDPGTGAGEGIILQWESASRADMARLYSIGNSTAGGDIVFATNSANTGTASERMRLDANGNLLIAKALSDGLALTGTFDYGAEFVGDGTSRILRIDRQAADGYGTIFTRGGTLSGYVSLTANGMTINGGSAGLVFATSATAGAVGTEAMRILANRNVLIGSTSDIGTRLQVADSFSISNASGTQYFLMGNRDSGGLNQPAIIRTANAVFDFGRGTSWASSTGGTFTGTMQVNTAANSVAVTGSISASTSVTGNTLNASGSYPALNVTSSSGAWELAVLRNTAAGCVIQFNTASSPTNGYDIGLNASEDAFTFRRNATEYARFSSSGYFTVGSTTVGVTNANSFSVLAGLGNIAVNHVNGTATGTAYQYFSYNGAAIGTITQNGTTGVLYNTTSDVRLKKNIMPALSASDLIDAVQVREFDWKSDGSHQRYGFVAQELHEVVPEAVSKPPEGSDEMWAVDYSKLVPLLLKELQELRARVAMLEQK